jgi:hypothetical protein
MSLPLGESPAQHQDNFGRAKARRPAFGRVVVLLFASALAAGVFMPSHAAHAATVTVVLTSGSTWTVPQNWNSASNTIEVIGGGGSGAEGQVGTGQGAGGGGGGYSSTTNVALTPGAMVDYAIGSGGAAAAAATGNSGTSTWFCNSSSNCASIAGTAVVAGANGGSGTGNGVGGAGATTVGAIGATKYAGGSGGRGCSKIPSMRIHPSNREGGSVWRRQKCYTLPFRNSVWIGSTRVGAWRGARAEREGGRECGGCLTRFGPSWFG